MGRADRLPFCIHGNSDKASADAERHRPCRDGLAARQSQLLGRHSNDQCDK